MHGSSVDDEPGHHGTREIQKMDENEQSIASLALTRRSVALLGAAGLLSAGVGVLTLTKVSAREAEPGDDRGGHGADDGPGDDHGHHRRRRRHHG